MKTKYILVSLAISINIILPSCKDEMDYNEFTGYDKHLVFSSFNRTNQFVTGVYSYLDHDFGEDYGGAMLASATDEADYAWSYSYIHDFYNGSWSPTNPKSGLWATAYSAIREANYYLEASKGLTFDDFKANKDYEKNMIRFIRSEFEVRFLRAYFYFNLVRQYGDVPFLTKVMSDKEINTLTRKPYKEVLQFIYDECDVVRDNLPVSQTNPNQENGRVGRIAAMALKARAKLYEASLLFNPNNDKNLWLEAAKANKAVIDSCAANNIKLGKYTDLWGTENYKASEMIFVKRIGDLNGLERYNFPIGVEGGSSGNCPTQNLVDAYEMKATGLAWYEPGSGYNERNPYAGRDPRFEMTIAKNGDSGWPSYNSRDLETFRGGANGLPISGATPTSYYLKKYVDPSVDLRPSTSNSKRHSWITYRLAEFYLNYAEATFQYLNSADATNKDLTMSARDAVNKIRKRTDVNMPDFPVGMTPTEFENKYMNERMVELAFEGHRFWDVRRWKKGKDFFKVINRMKLTKDQATGKISYERETIFRQWNDKMYFFPIPDKEIRKNPNLTQNEGWK